MRIPNENDRRLSEGDKLQVKDYAGIYHVESVAESNVSRVAYIIRIATGQRLTLSWKPAWGFWSTMGKGSLEYAVKVK